MPKQYLVCVLLAILTLITACESESVQTARFDRFRAESLLESMKTTGLDIQNEHQDMIVPAGVPATYNSRYLFEIGQVAPSGGQLLTFNSAENMAAWQTYVDQQRNNSTTRRNYTYVYTAGNAMLILSPSVTTDLAVAYRNAFERVTAPSEAD
ncbi:MAG: hypothetical protein K8L99_18535 [Anaerolineae bacterium]|nr:hypothetical protein [Anaerolineae bacterium]